MYLARHVGRWSTTVIGRFYNGRDHSTVCHGIQRIEALRESDPDVDALITNLKTQLSAGDDSPNAVLHKNTQSRVSLSQGDLEALAGLIAERVYAYLGGRTPDLEKDHSMTTVWRADRYRFVTGRPSYGIILSLNLINILRGGLSGIR